MKIVYDNGLKEIVVRIPLGDDEVAAAETTSSGKSKLLATSKGFTDVDGTPYGNVRISINLIKIIPKDQRK